MDTNKLDEVESALLIAQMAYDEIMETVKELQERIIKLAALKIELTLQTNLERR